MLSLVRGSNLDGDIGVADDLAIHGDGFVFDSVEKALCVYIRLLPLRNIGIFINPLCHSIRGALTRTRQTKTQQNEQHDDGRFHDWPPYNGITVLERYVAPTLARPVASANVCCHSAWRSWSRYVSLALPEKSPTKRHEKHKMIPEFFGLCAFLWPYSPSSISLPSGFLMPNFSSRY